jgi:choline-sulfatase
MVSRRYTRVAYTSDRGDNFGALGMWGKSTHYDDAAGCR